MRRIGVLTSGGDAPGMNAAIRAVVRSGLDRGWEVFGIRRGYRGLIDADAELLGPRDVGGIIHRGGTILGTSRCPEFMEQAGQRQALRSLERLGLDGLVIVGGSGSQVGTLALARAGAPAVGVASTIDNDLAGIDITLGVDTALNIALEAIDRLKVTASSLGRAFLVEVMGRECGYLALMAALAGGAEAVILPGVACEPEALAATIDAAYERGKAHAIVVVAEGADYNAERLVNYFKENQRRLGFELRATILGHVQRGGAPGAFDRLLGTRSGAGAVEQLAQGAYGRVVGLRQGRIAAVPLDEVVLKRPRLDPELVELAAALARQ
ncbi:MAG TPA: ATP-dependent 6-phosphofructokinase [Nitrolancea sp.]|nr:ATP-dependent 6-phosphofructokinase [Nitrolancea sp.]